MTDLVLEVLEKQKLLDKFNELDKRDTVVYEPRFSRHQETGTLMLIGIIARKVPRYFYQGEIAEKHRLLIVKLIKELQINGNSVIVSMEFPYSIPDLEAMWECMFNVWVKPEKKANYAKRFQSLINNKLRQAKLNMEVP